MLRWTTAIAAMAVGLSFLVSMARSVEVYAAEPDVTIRPASPRVVIVVHEIAQVSRPLAVTPEPTPEPTPGPSPVLMALVRSTPTAVPVRPLESSTMATRAQAVYDGLARSAWPRGLWDRVVEIARCESKLDPTDDTGDGGLAWGLMQIRSDAHPDVVARYNVLTIDGALAGAWLVYTRAGYSFQPWSCA